MGQRFAQFHNGLCPKDAQNPAGKSLQISFIGPIPHITYDPIGGSDFLIISLLASKLQFLPKFVPALSYNMKAEAVGSLE